jgi:tripartite-type tricarboxylate transporter receptor subunit TctC
MPRLLTIAVLAIIPQIVEAQAASNDWPNRPIQLVVPFPAGSGTDVVARILAQRLAERLKQSVVIDNRSGASGTLGSEFVSKAAPDGYTFGIATASTHAVAPNMENKPRYDPIRDFSYVATLGASPYVLVAYPGLKLKNIGDLITLAKKKPDALNYGSAGAGSLAHLATALFAQMTGIKMTHIPYKASANSLSDLISGRLDMQLSTIAPMLANISDGRLTALAVSGSNRVSALPGVPTFVESGVPEYEASLWMVVAAPPAVPAPIVERMNRELNQVLGSDAGPALVKQGLEIKTGSPADAAELVRRDMQKWKSVISEVLSSK